MVGEERAIYKLVAVKGGHRYDFHLPVLEAWKGARLLSWICEEVSVYNEAGEMLHHWCQNTRDEAGTYARN